MPDPQPTLDLEAIRERNWRTLRHAGHDCGEAAQAAADFAALLAALEEARRERDELREMTATCTCYDGNPANYDGPHADCAVHGAIRAYNEVSAELASVRLELKLVEEERAAAMLACDASRAEVEQLRHRLDLAEGRIDGDAWDRLTEERDRLAAEVERTTEIVEKARAWFDTILMTQTPAEAALAAAVLRSRESKESPNG